MRCGGNTVYFLRSQSIFSAPSASFVVKAATVGLLLLRPLVVDSYENAKILSIVQQFVIERDIPGAGSLTEAEIREVSLRSLDTLKEMGPKIQWLHSYVTEDKVYCVYLAADADAIMEHARRSRIPANRVAAVRRLIDPKRIE